VSNSISAEKSFYQSRYKSVKHSNYFAIYDEILNSYKNREVKVLEIGVLNGGGLFMLRGILGKKAKIVGVDLNPSCLRFKDFGFEILTGDQSDPQFWGKFFRKMGKFDIIIEDGGHTNNQQIKSLNSCIGFVNDGGVYITEDVHTSYWFEFGNPSRFSYINYAKKIIDVVNSRGPRIRPALNNSFYKNVYSLSFYQSIVCFHVDRIKSKPSSHIQNSGKSFAHEDFRDRSLLAYPLLRLINKSKLKLLIYVKLLVLYLSYKLANIKNAKEFLYLKNRSKIQINFKDK
jgi:hypothetical protein